MPSWEKDRKILSKRESETPRQRKYDALLSALKEDESILVSGYPDEVEKSLHRLQVRISRIRTEARKYEQ